MPPPKTAVKNIEVTILDRTYRVACPDDERENLMASVAYLDQKMREIKEGGKIAGADRIAVMAALNITHELLSAKTGAGFDLAEYKRRMQSMNRLVDEALASQEKLF
ncbi:MAG: cell division protein ZapA [Burkholderiales bacterium]|nr:cell division protein ZapA [Burkholderiales bacterium]